MDIRRNMEI